MLAKLITLILFTALVGSSLLVVRQRRIEAAHELAHSQRAMAQLDEKLWRVRLEIARSTSPARVREMLAALDEPLPILADWCVDASGDSRPYILSDSRFFEIRADRRGRP